MHIRWSEPTEVYNLEDPADLRGVDEQVLREGTPMTLRTSSTSTVFLCSGTAWCSPRASAGDGPGGCRTTARSSFDVDFLPVEGHQDRCDLDEVGGFASTGAAMLGFGTPMVATAGRVESGAILRSR